MRSNTLIKLLLLLAFFPLSAIPAEDDFSIYQAETRPAQDLTRMVQEMVDGVRVQSLNEKIVVYGTKKQRAAALKLMRELDKPARMYRVHVRAIGRTEAAREAAAIEGGIGGRDVRVGKGKSGVLRGGGGTISVGGLSGTAESQSEEGKDQGAQQITVIDGGTAEIGASSGLFPSGAQVTLRSQGKGGANLKLKQQASSGSKVQNLNTEIDVKLGVWRTVGSVNQKNEGQDSELLGKSANASSSSQDIQVMVELAD